MNVLENVKANLFREPRKRRIDWMPVVFGSFLTVLSFVAVLGGTVQGTPFRLGPEFGILGLAFVSMGGAELLSVDRRKSTALLRTIAIASFVSFLAASILTF